MLRARQRLDLRRMQGLRRDLQMSAGPVQSARKESVEIYRDFMIRRFVLFSYGAGTWKPITKSRAKKKGNTRILVDTRFLLQKLRSVLEVVRETTRSMFIAFRSTLRHPTANMTVAELAEIHHGGLGSNPKRLILVEPDEQTIRGMQGVHKRHFQGALR